MNITNPATPAKATQEQPTYASETRIAAAVEAAYILEAVRR
jgi:hypothetical protein